MSAPRSTAAPCARRWRLAPLLETSRYTTRDLAAHARVSHAAMQLAAKDGLDTDEADRWAVAVGLNPVEVWGWEWNDAGLFAAGDGEGAW